MKFDAPVLIAFAQSETRQRQKRRRNEKGGPTQSRLNLTNHHYKEPLHLKRFLKNNNGVMTLSQFYNKRAAFNPQALS